MNIHIHNIDALSEQEAKVVLKLLTSQEAPQHVVQEAKHPTPQSIVQPIKHTLRTCRRWTNEDVAYLKEHADAPVGILVARLQRTPSAIWNKMSQEKISARKHMTVAPQKKALEKTTFCNGTRNAHWTVEEVSTLVKHKTMGTNLFQETFMPYRTKGAIDEKRSALGITGSHHIKRKRTPYNDFIGKRIKELYASGMINPHAFKQATKDWNELQKNGEKNGV